MQRGVFHARARVESCGIAMQHLAPARVLERGYSIVEHRGDILRDSADVLCGDAIAVRLARGRLVAIVTATENVVPLASDDR
jgi:exonuclease VII large subunit